MVCWNNKGTLKKIFNTKIRRSKKCWKTETTMGGQHESRCENATGQNLKNAAFNRDKWTQLLMKAMAHQGLWS
jgi:hypothetical protein